ncbi:uncharacterized protein KIAA2013 homolog [Corticium candelabrum]|uniref:uncharacterized protein KIAA2013 homolog n=1 Tax=Corticium candelabrum TaxID=121492 RepID=UPI002E25C750|nr:uncharacterized protein KIAA2013 homolog [Corticium candelabrum]
MNRVRNGITFLLASRQRKLMLLIFIVTCIAVYYYTTSKPDNTRLKMKVPTKPRSSSPCAQQILSQWDHLPNSDVDIYIPSRFHSPSFQFIGNGWVGSSVGSTGLYISHQGFLSLLVPLSPFVEASIDGHKMSLEASVIEFKKGIVHHIYVYKNSRGQCVTLQTTVYAHHSITPLIVQELHFKNGMAGKCMVQMNHVALNGWTGSTRRQLDLKGSVWPNIKHYQLLTGMEKAQVESTSTEIILSMATTDPPEPFTLANHGVSHTHIASVVIYNTSTSTSQQKTEAAASKELETLVTKKPASLRSSHSSIWMKSCVSTVIVAEHSDTSIPQQAAITSSLYYAKSALTPQTISHAERDKQKEEKTHCYTGLPTMHVVSLWSIPTSKSHYLKLIGNWRSHLVEGGCLAIFTGVQVNVEQSIIRSFISLQDTGKLIQLAANPLTLQAPISISHFLYQKHYMSLTITLNREQLPATMSIVAMQVDGKQPVKPLYVCPAGCKDTPIELKLQSPIHLPVIATSPPTPLLFISNDDSYLQEMGKQLHIDTSMQHEGHMSSSSHLSTKFWVCLGLLVAAFHIVLLRIVYKEYFYGGSDGAKGKFGGNRMS